MRAGIAISVVFVVVSSSAFPLVVVTVVVPVRVWGGVKWAGSLGRGRVPCSVPGGCGVM